MTTIALFGHPVAHSISPAFQQAAFDALALPLRYEALDTPPEHLPAALASLRRGERIGANVTVPHKEAVLPLLDHLDDAARTIGAVNTIVRGDDGRLTGHNTDVDGFLEALREEGGFDPAAARALVLGAGGAARAVVYGLLRAGAERVWVENRTSERALALVRALDPGDGRLAAVTSAHSVPPPRCTLIVNCTSLGLAHSREAARAFLSEAQIPSGITVCDIVANPQVTPLLDLAQRRGCRTLGGLPMLVRQGAAAFTLWTGRAAPVDVMFAAARRAMGR